MREARDIGKPRSFSVRLTVNSRKPTTGQPLFLDLTEDFLLRTRCPRRGRNRMPRSSGRGLGSLGGCHGQVRRVGRAQHASHWSHWNRRHPRSRFNTGDAAQRFDGDVEMWRCGVELPKICCRGAWSRRPWEPRFGFGFVCSTQSTHNAHHVGALSTDARGGNMGLDERDASTILAHFQAPT